ncbi:hypothetical protein BN1008_2730 [Escherichia coli]|nr:hypothetical protein BN1008_2730 [Escherichia coli]
MMLSSQWTQYKPWIPFNTVFRPRKVYGISLMPETISPWWQTGHFILLLLKRDDQYVMNYRNFKINLACNKPGSVNILPDSMIRVGGHAFIKVAL